MIAPPLDEFAGHSNSITKQRHEFIAAARRAIHHRDVAGPGERQLHRDRPGRPSRAKQHHAATARVHLSPQRLEKPLAVGVFADESLASPDHAVDGSHHGRRFAKAVEMIDHGHLVRQAAVESPEADGPQPTDGVAEILRGDLHVHVPPG